MERRATTPARRTSVRRASAAALTVDERVLRRPSFANENAARRFGEDVVGEIAERCVQLPVALEEDDRAIAHVDDHRARALFSQVLDVDGLAVFARDPPRVRALDGLVTDLDAVFVLQA